ncbi:M56 family metallopeptidase [Carboxylicivirga sp. RSCT41]|uniref:M56 family metallopeptidase n=1 Tax=Carboxylicivirga agarovorans TaxID=3417570 RepID=UPI003D33DB61
MSRFLIYLFESGLCLTLFYIGYILFFRKETYFTFNRIYLVTSMVVSLLLPLSNVQISLNSGEVIGNALATIGEFRNYYEELILMTEPDFIVGNEPAPVPVGKVMEQSVAVESRQAYSSISLSGILFYIYISGVLFFTSRLLLLIYNLYRIVRQNKVIHNEGFNIVLINDDMPSFSFINWIFVNKDVLQPEEFEQVITHEKVHVQHKHSVDLLLAHIITIFQWFNPLTWRIQKSIKTCHEYIADRQVIDQGHELFDYQSLLLSQLISIRSVELVNNFNLLSIKKRIAMMNKIKSGFSAKMKALLVVPMVIFAFFFFANMTGNNRGHQEMPYSKLIEGSWIAQEKITGAEQYLKFDNEEALFVTIDEENVMVIDEYGYHAHQGTIYLTKGDDESILAYKVEDGHLVIMKNGKETTFERFDGREYVVMEGEIREINVPTARSVKTFNYDYIHFSILLSKDGLYVDGTRSDIDNLQTTLKQKMKDLMPKKKSILLEIDKSMSMKEVDKIKQALRFNDLLKIGYVAKADKSTGIKDGQTALLNLLPPKDAKWIEEDDLSEKGISLFTINHSSSASLKELQRQLHQHVLNKKKYVLKYEYSDQTSYNDYIKTLDMIYSTIWNLRKEQAFFSGIDYNNMTKEQEKELRKKYPLTLTMKNVDSDK